MNEKYLPIGTVVRLRDGKKNLMIIGFMTDSSQTNNKVYDYIGVLYPEGVLSTDMNFLFDHNQIEEVLFKGYVTEEEITFKKRLIEFANHGTIDGKIIDDNSMNVQGNVSQSHQPVHPQMFTTNN